MVVAVGLSIGGWVKCGLLERQVWRRGVAVLGGVCREPVQKSQRIAGQPPCDDCGERVWYCTRTSEKFMCGEGKIVQVLVGFVKG